MAFMYLFIRDPYSQGAYSLEGRQLHKLFLGTIVINVTKGNLKMKC